MFLTTNLDGVYVIGIVTVWHPPGVNAGGTGLILGPTPQLGGLLRKITAEMQSYKAKEYGKGGAG